MIADKDQSVKKHLFGETSKSDLPKKGSKNNLENECMMAQNGQNKNKKANKDNQLTVAENWFRNLAY